MCIRDRNYDDYFERCADCGRILEEIHNEERDPIEIDEDGRCIRCGLQLREPEAV